MAAPAPPPTLKEAPPPFFVEHLFFKSFPVLSLPSPAPARELLDRSSHSLSCSSKYGVLIIGGQQRLTIIPVKELLLVQTLAGNSHQKQVELDKVPYATVNHPSFGSSPTIVAISIGEEFLALDTIRNGVSFVLIFKLGEFLTPGSGCQPVVELRASSREGSKVSGIAWNPGENMSNMLAINCDDGSLQLASIKGVNAVEMCSYKDSSVRSMCWSPKGKQLVVGKGDGSLCQLKLDLNEAKKIPSPGQGQVPSALFWTATTQFLVNYVVQDRDIDLMQLDLSKGAPLSFAKFGDVYVSDRVDSQAKCSFIPILPWNVIICASNTINDLVVIGKGLHEPSENWIVADLNDNRRAAIPIDSFAVGAALFTGFESPVTFDETESYHSMPVVFVLSDSGALASFVLVNSKKDTPPVFQKVSNALPPQLFLSSGDPPQAGSQSVPVPASLNPELQIPKGQTTTDPVPQTGNFGLPSFGTSNISLFGNQSISQQASSTTNLPKLETGLNFSMPSATGGATNFSFGTGLNFSTTISTSSNMTSTQPQSTTSTIVQPVVSAKPASVVLQPPANNKPLFDLKSLPKTGLPTLQQVEDLKRIVEEKRAQGGFGEAEESDEPDMEELLLEVEKFQKRLELHNKRKEETCHKTVQSFNELRKEHEANVLTPLNLMEDFVATLKETKDIQSEEVNGIKERVFSHYTELEYAKALVERNEDPKYLELLMAQPMDAGRAKKFCETEKLYQYVKNQTAECERFFRYQTQQPNSYQNSSDLQGIYQTLANHSKVIRKLAHNMNALRSQMGLAKIPGIEDTRIFEIPTMGQNYYEKKPLLKERPTITVQKSNVTKIKAEKDDGVTLDDLTAGLSRVKLNKLRDSAGGHGGFTSHKPMRISTKKLEALTQIVSNVEEIEIPGNDKNYDPFDISVKNRARSRNLINKLDDKTIPLIKSENNIPEEINKIIPAAAAAPAVVVPISMPAPKAKATMASKSILSTPPVLVAPTKTSPAAAQAVMNPSTRSIAPTPMVPASTVEFIENLSKVSISPSPLLGFGTAPTLTPTTAPLAFGPSSSSPSLFGSTLPKPGFGNTPLLFGATPTATPAAAFATSPAFGSGVLKSSSPSVTAATSILFTPPPTTPATTSPSRATVTITPTPNAGPISSSEVAPARNPNLLNKLDDKPIIPLAKSESKILEEINKTTPAAAVVSITSPPNPLVSSSAPNLITSSASPNLITSPSVPLAKPPTAILSIPTTAAPPTTPPATPPLTAPPVAVAVAVNPSTQPIAAVAVPPSAGLTTTAPAAAPLAFGSITSSPSLFGASPKPAFGSAPLFGATPTATFATSPAFGSGGSPFGSAFGSSLTNSTAGAGDGNIFASPAPTTTSSSLFGATTSSAPAFGSPTATTSVFGASSPFGGSVFGGSTTPAVVGGGGGGEGSIFASTTSSSLFGGATSPKPAFGNSTSGVFGGAPAFGSPAAATFGGSPAFGSVSGSTFGSAFGLSSPPTGGGGGAGDSSIFGSPSATTTTSSSLFGTASPKTAFGSAPVFGSAPAFGSPTFGGSPAFGSGGSTFGSAFGSSGGGGTGEGSIFGGGSIQQSAPSFGALAQAAPPAQGFGSFGSPGGQTMGGGSLFGGTAQPSSPFGGGGQQTSLFGGGGAGQSSPFGQQQQQQASVFGGTAPAASFGGGSAFSSWR